MLQLSGGIPKVITPLILPLVIGVCSSGTHSTRCRKRPISSPPAQETRPEGLVRRCEGRTAPFRGDRRDRRRKNRGASFPAQRHRCANQNEVERLPWEAVAAIVTKRYAVRDDLSARWLVETRIYQQASTEPTPPKSTLSPVTCFHTRLPSTFVF